MRRITIHIPIHITTVALGPALNSEQVCVGIRDILLNHAGLWESLRSKAEGAPAG